MPTLHCLTNSQAPLTQEPGSSPAAGTVQFHADTEESCSSQGVLFLGCEFTSKVFPPLLKISVLWLLVMHSLVSKKTAHAYITQYAHILNYI